MHGELLSKARSPGRVNSATSSYYFLFNSEIKMPKKCHSAECCLNAANEIDWTTKARQTANIFVNLSITCSLNSVSSAFSFFTGLSLSLSFFLSPGQANTQACSGVWIGVSEQTQGGLVVIYINCTANVRAGKFRMTCQP
jgi:hypothetical protein